jgi:type I restriction enzyme, S subunit
MSAWPQKKLGEILDFFSGYAWKAAKFSDDVTGIPIIRIQNVDAVRQSDFAYWIEDYDPRFLIGEGDILLTLSGSFRVEVWPGPKALLNQRIVKVTPKKQVNKDWLLFALRNVLAEIEGMGRHALVNNVALSDLRDLVISLPPLDEQKRIAAILDQADALRRKRQRALDRLNQLGQAIFYEMFGDPSTNPKGWPVGTIENLTASTQYGTSEKAGSEGAFGILRMGNLTNAGEIDLGNMKYIDFPASDVEKYTVLRGDILFNRTNSPDLVGKTAVYQGDEALGFAGYLVRLRVNDQAAPEYISAYLNCPVGKKILRGMCKAIIGMANINAKELRTIPIPLPPKQLQFEFAEKLAALKSALAEPKSQMVLFHTLFTSLQSRAFKGEL